MSITFITNDQLYKQAIEPVSKASSFVWIGTADMKDLHVHHKGSVQSFLAILDSLLKRKVAIMNQFDDVWLGKYCKNCRRKQYCQDPII
jgi:hypothetical protein